ncbi:MAG: amino acid ABC transporter, partial [Mesorhizobium sp.]
MKTVLKTFAAALLFGVAAMGVAKADQVKIGVAAEPYPPFTSPDATG